MKSFPIFTIAGFIACTAFANDLPNYPRDNFAHTGERIAVFEGMHQQVMPRALLVQVDPTFSDAQKVILEKAAKIFFDRALKKEVIDCAFAASHRGQPENRRKFELQLYDASAIRQLKELLHPAALFIAKFQQQGAVGLAYVNLFYDAEKPLTGYKNKHYLHIAINEGYLGDSSKWYGRDTSYWAGVIAHEVLHNLGFRHGSGRDYKEDYAGYFITEYGKCVESNGVAFDLSCDANERTEEEFVDVMVSK